MSAMLKTLDNTMMSTTCCSCGVEFAFPNVLYRARLDDHHSFFCPNGHSQAFVGKSDAEKLRDQLASATKAKEWAEQRARLAEDEAVALKAKAERLKKRAAAGVCPCCHRTVSQMARHMSTKHPEYAR